MKSNKTKINSHPTSYPNTSHLRKAAGSIRHSGIIGFSSDKNLTQLKEIANSPKSSIDKNNTDASNNQSYSSTSSSTVQLQRNRRKWTDAQREQSRVFWEKKRKKEARQMAARKALLYKKQRAAEKQEEIRKIGRLRRVSAPAGAHSPMTPRTQPVVPADTGATKRYKDVVGHVSDFLHPDHSVRSLHNDGGPQFIQQFDNEETAVTRRVGIDVEPSSHVRKLKPHINLQTQHNKKIQKGDLADPHHPIASVQPFASSAPENEQKPLHGMQLQPEENRKFIERYLLSSGINVERE